jgi:hypothetical protein
MKKILDIVLAFAFSFTLFSVAAFAADNNISILIPTSGQTFFVGDLVTVSGQVNLITGDKDPTKFGVTIEWGDTTITDCLPLSGADNPYTYSTNSSTSHSYSSIGAKVITVELFHVCTHGQDKSKADSTADINISIIVPTCEITASPNPNFGLLQPNQISADGVYTRLTNAGNSGIASLTMEGQDWTDGGTNNFDTSYTRYNEITDTTYDLMLTLPKSPSTATLSGIPVGNNLDVYFKLKIPAGQAPTSYMQTITFTGSC